MKNTKPTLFSAIKATGKMHLGNYLGAIKNWVELQNSGKYKTIYSIVDLHTLTIKINPKELRENIIEMAADIIACGIDPQKSIFFIQSHVKEHAELAWILNCITPVAELERMTQYKDKAKRHKENVNAGLLDYPVLMAADILLYKAKVVPVGNDQSQHLEFTRKIVRKFNQRWGKYFEEPQTVLTSIPRLKSLTDPTKKMSKDLGPKSYIAIADSPDKIREKIKFAVTDIGGPGSKISGGENLLNLFEQFSDDKKLISKFKNDYKNKKLRYAELKPALAEAIINYLKPIQEKRQRLLNNKKYLEEVLMHGEQQAKIIAEKNLNEIKEIIGIL